MIQAQHERRCWLSHIIWQSIKRAILHPDIDICQPNRYHILCSKINVHLSSGITWCFAFKQKAMSVRCRVASSVWRSSCLGTHFQMNTSHTSPLFTQYEVNLRQLIWTWGCSNVFPCGLNNAYLNSFPDRTIPDNLEYLQMCSVLQHKYGCLHCVPFGALQIGLLDRPCYNVGGTRADLVSCLQHGDATSTYKNLSKLDNPDPASSIVRGTHLNSNCFFILSCSCDTTSGAISCFHQFDQWSPTGIKKLCLKCVHAARPIGMFTST